MLGKISQDDLHTPLMLTPKGDAIASSFIKKWATGCPPPSQFLDPPLQNCRLARTCCSAVACCGIGVVSGPLGSGKLSPRTAWQQGNIKKFHIKSIAKFRVTNIT